MDHLRIEKLNKAFFETLPHRQIAVLVDGNTHRFCYPLLQNFLPKHKIISIQSGEEHKNLETSTQIWQALTDFQFDRKALLINLGGGVIGDMGGFCAATYKRGIDFIHIPTTLLAQVDASIGGKLAIDFKHLKNHIGVFQNPTHVLIDSFFLKTLPFEELRSGFAEMIKHALIADAAEWENIKKIDLKTADWTEIVSRSIEVKKKVVDQDPHEKGLRKILNFGHTVGHAIESFYLENTDLKRKLRHGEAIAIGMICESQIAKEKGFLSEAELLDIQGFILSLYPRQFIAPSEIEIIVSYTSQDKKNWGKTINGSLLNRIGEANYDIPLSEKDMKDSLWYYKGLVD